MSASMQLKHAVCITIGPRLKPYLDTFRLILPYQLTMGTTTSCNANKNYDADGNPSRISHKFLQYMGNVDQ